MYLKQLHLHLILSRVGFSEIAKTVQCIYEVMLQAKIFGMICGRIFILVENFPFFDNKAKDDLNFVFLFINRNKGSGTFIRKGDC